MGKQILHWNRVIFLELGGELVFEVGLKTGAYLSYRDA